MCGNIGTMKAMAAKVRADGAAALDSSSVVRLCHVVWVGPGLHSANEAE
jgi:hypothetical protein